jgi:inorganic pyrophosphatase
MDEQVFPGCVVESRLIGVIEGEQEEERETTRNDRLVAVAKESHTHSDLTQITDINRRLLDEVAQFFVNYHQLSGSTFKVLGFKGPKEASRLLKKAIKNAA